MRLLKTAFITLALIAFVFAGLIATFTWKPEPVTHLPVVCSETATAFDPQQSLTVASYNVQFFAGKDYVFYYDLPDNRGPDLRPSPHSIQTTVAGIADLLNDVDADVVLLQEIHDGASATDHEDQLQKLLAHMPHNKYPCQAQAFYWKADFVPHPAILGSVGMKLVTLSKHRLSNAIRHSLPQPPMDPISARFYLQRAVLSVDMETTEGNPSWRIMNTHFDAFAQGSDTMEQQVSIANRLIQEGENQGMPTLLGGDYNLLPPGARERLSHNQRYLYKEHSEIEPLLKNWQSFPDVQAIDPNNQTLLARSYTHYPNDPDVSGPDRTIDYIFYNAALSVQKGDVIQTPSALSLSDHLPLVVSVATYTEKE